MFDPLLWGGNVLALSAANQIGSDLSTLSTLADSSGQGNNCTGTSIKLRTNYLNGLTAIGCYDGYITLPQSCQLDRQNFTLIFVGRFNSNGNQATYAGLGDGSGASAQQNWYQALANQNFFPSSGLTPPLLVRMEPHIFALRVSGGTATVFRNTAQTAAGTLASGTLKGGYLFQSYVGGFPQTGAFTHILAYSRGLSDNEMGQLIAAALNYLRQNAVTAARNFAFVGDSLTFGYYALQTSGVAADSYPQQVMAQNPGYAAWNCGTSGAQINAFVSPDSVYASGQTNLCVVWGGANDLIANQTAATLQSRLQTYVAARRSTGWKVVVSTVTPVGGGYYTAGRETERTSFNTWLRANWGSFADALIDPAAESNLSDYNNTTYFSDGLHLTKAGYSIVAGLAVNALAGL